jgi:hypothetical protein
MSQEERSIFWDVTVSVILSKNVYTRTQCDNEVPELDFVITLNYSDIVDLHTLQITVTHTLVFSVW